jgi:uncharacterized membrane protein
MDSMWTIASHLPQSQSPPPPKVVPKIPVFGVRRCLLWTSTKRIVSIKMIMMSLMIYIITISSLWYSNSSSCHAFVPSTAQSFIQPPPPSSSSSSSSSNVMNNIHDVPHGRRVSFPVATTTTCSFTPSTPTPLYLLKNDVTWHTSDGDADMRRQSPLFSVRLCPNVQRGVRYIKERFLHFVHRTSLGTNTKNIIQIAKRILFHQLRRTVFVLSLFFMITFHTVFLPSVVANAAVSGGRVGGGSFKSSSSGRVSTLSRPSSSSSSRSRNYYPSPQIRTSPIIINSFSGNRGWYAPTPESALIMSRVSTKDIILVTGTGMLLAYGYNNLRRRENSHDNDSILGAGYTVGSMTVSINVPDRSSSDNILHQLNQLALSADTMTKRGLQDLLSSVTLELLRHEQSITSAYTQSKLYPIMGQAEREFQVLSVASQSKVDRLTGTYLLVTPIWHLSMEFISHSSIVSPPFFRTVAVVFILYQ